MKNSIEYSVNSRFLTSYHPLEIELVQNNKNYLFDLSYLSVLNIRGDKALDFLQGQLTCDLRLVSKVQMMQGAQCNLQGRILALFDIIQWHGFQLILPKDLVELTQKSFTKSAQLSRLVIQSSHDLKIFGFYLQNPSDLIPNTSPLPSDFHELTQDMNYCCYHLGDGFYIFIIQADMEQSFCKIFAEKEQLFGSLTWHILRLYKQQINIYPESRNLFLPHRLGLQHTPYLSFNKGCYKGQEIIARTHYKATIKHELAFYIIQSEQNIYSGQKLFSLDTKAEVGELIDYAPLSKERYLIAVTIFKEARPLVLFEGQELPLLLQGI